MSEPAFEGVLAAHRLHASMNICVGCEWRATPDTGSLTDQHAAHLSAALHAEVARWLGDEGTREVVARVIASETADEPMWSAMVIARHALAALTTTDQEDYR